MEPHLQENILHKGFANTTVWLKILYCGRPKWTYLLLYLLESLGFILWSCCSTWLLLLSVCHFWFFRYYLTLTLVPFVPFDLYNAVIMSCIVAYYISVYLGIYVMFLVTNIAHWFSSWLFLLFVCVMTNRVVYFGSLLLRRWCNNFIISLSCSYIFELLGRGPLQLHLSWRR